MKHNKWILRISTLAAILCIWQTASMIAGPLFIPSLDTTISALIKLIYSGELITALSITLLIMLTGFILALVLGISLGIILGWFKPLATALEPYINALNSTPHIVFLPVIILWLGIDVQAKIFYVFFASIFPILINSMYGVRYSDESLIETAVAYHASSSQILTKVILPASIPFIMSGLKLGLARAIITVIISEMFFKLEGIGALVLRYGDLFKMDTVFAIIIILIILTQIIFKISDVAEKRTAKWREA